MRAFVVTAPVTTRVRNLKSEVHLGPEDGLPKPCVVNTSTLETIPKTALIRRLATLSPSKRDAVDKALSFSLGLD
jgi:mRNA interferase MazF